MARVGETSRGGMRSSAGCRNSAGISLYSAHAGTIEGGTTTAVAIGLRREPDLLGK